MTDLFYPERSELDELKHRVIQASAGSGKTFALSSRYLQLLRRGVAPDTILATTFTRKAASEILGRVLLRLAKGAKDSRAAAELGESLNEASEKNPLPVLTLEQCREMLWRVVGGLHRVSIMTIDSFFYRMVMCFGYELGVPLRARIVTQSDPVSTQLRRQAIDAMLGDDDLDTLLTLLRRFQCDHAGRGVAQAIDQIVCGDLYQVYRQNPEAKVWAPLDRATKLLDEVTLAGAIELLNGLTPCTPSKTWGNALKKDREAAIRRDWPAFLKKGLTEKIASSEPTYAGRIIPDEVLEIYKPLVDHAHGAMITQIAEQTQATYHLLKRFDEHYIRLRQEHGVLHYNDLPVLLARDLPGLGEDMLMQVYYRLDSRVGHLLVDEYQDTSDEQWQVLEPFAQEIAAYRDGSRSFFCVGDTKQAIYGWRGGCAQLFDQIEEDLHLEPDSTESLDASYRSSGVVLDAVNRVFERLAENEALSDVSGGARQWQDRFRQQTANYPDQPGYVELITAPGSPGLVGEDRDVASRDTGQTGVKEPTGRRLGFAAQRIVEIFNRHPGGSIGVLVTTNAHVRQMTDLLRNKGLDASGEGAKPIVDDPAVQVVLSALILADHPGHGIAAFHVLHSGLAKAIGLHDTSAGHVAGVGAAIRGQLISEGYASVISRWAMDLEPLCDRRNALRLTQLIELADRYDSGITLRPGDFVEYVKNTAIDETTAWPIRVMTINKAKGLEFDVVVLADLQRQMLRNNDAQVYVLKDPSDRAVRGVYRGATEKVRAGWPALQEAYGQHVTRQVHDDLSKLYVAMTRARHGLHMIIDPITKTKKGEIAKNGWASPSYAAILRRGLSQCEAQEDLAGAQVLYVAGQPDWVDSDWFKEKCGQTKTNVSREHRGCVKVSLASPNRKAPARSWRQVNPSSLEAGGRVKAGDLLAIEVSQARQRGAVLHGWFELIDWLDVDDRSRLDNQALLESAYVVEPGIDEEELSELMSRFRQMLSQPGVGAALAHPELAPGQQVELWKERGFAVQIDGRLVTGRFDRVVVYRQQGQPVKVEVIDFKTDRIWPDKKNLPRLIQTYRPQIEAYRMAVSTMLNLPPAPGAPGAIRASLVFVDSGDRYDIKLSGKRGSRAS